MTLTKFLKIVFAHP